MRIELTKSQCKNVAKFIEFNLLSAIRNDDCIDNIYWVSEMLKAMEALEKVAKEGEEE